MKKLICISLITLISASLLVGCSKKSDNTSNSQNSNTDIVASVKKSDTVAKTLPGSIKNAGKLSMGLDDSYPPMEYRDDQNKLVGFDVDLGNAICNKLGIKAQWVPTAFDGIPAALQANKFNMILSALSDTPEREKEMLFTKPYSQGGPIIVTTKANSSIKTSADFKGKVIGVQLGTTAEDALKEISTVKETRKYDKITEALQDLSNGRLDAVVADDQVGRYYTALSPDKFITTGKLHDEPLGIGFKLSDTALRDSVQAAIDDLKADGTLSKLSVKWFKTDLYNK